MGVPAFFRWLSKKYPSIIVYCDDGVKGQYHFDNLYLDMNGIIHPCSHPENKPPPANEEEMFQAIFEYVEDIMKIVKPKKLLYMAVDGVAPRAKMNQQRSRRFRASQESYEKLIEIKKIKDNLRERGVEIQEKADKAHFDSNVITPGTEFMMNLSDALRGWINRRLSDDFNDVNGIWPNDLVIILSDASVPGEGEHKIMDYIRRQKADKNFDPSLSHCLYGADADLIMLGLATHEPNFTILREEFKPNQPRPCDLCGQLGHELKDCTGEVKPPEDLPIVAPTEFIYIRLNVLREYLAKEAAKECRLQLDFERFIDDYVFLCFFVGNDFLPHLPSLEIRENAIDRLIKLYKYVMEAYPDSNDMYLTKNGFVNKHRVQLVLKELGEYEDEIFKQRQESDLAYKARNKRRKLFQAQEDLKWMKPEIVSQHEKPEVFHNAKEEAYKVRMAFKDQTDQASSSSSSSLQKMMINPNENTSNATQQAQQEQSNSNKRKRDEYESDSEPEDNVQLYNDGWKERYYLHKFGSKSVEKISKQVADEYFKGLCWVMLYYYQGCPDWKWFFPYHYACFASDFRDIDQLDVKFDSEAQPFHPLEQLMSVFPAASSQSLPPTWRDLMTNKESTIIDFYPTTFRIDLNGKKAAWMGVALLPFIDEDRLFNALKDVYDNLTEREKFRNRRGTHLIFTSKKHSLLSDNITNVIENEPATQEEKNEGTSISTPSPTQSNLISGKLKKSELFSKVYSQTLCCEFFDPKYQNGFIFRAILLKNARIPKPVLKPQDIAYFENYRPVIGMNNRNNRAYLGIAGHRIIERSVHKQEYDHRNQPYHNQYGYQNYRYEQYQYPSQQQQQQHNSYDDNQNYSYRNYNSNNRNHQPQRQYQQQQRGYSSNNTNTSSNYNSNNYQSNYSTVSYYQQQRQQPQQQSMNNRGPNYQQHYHSNRNYYNYNQTGAGTSSHSGNSSNSKYPTSSSSSPNVSSYYTSDYQPRTHQYQQSDDNNKRPQHYQQGQNRSNYKNQRYR